MSSAAVGGRVVFERTPTDLVHASTPVSPTSARDALILDGSGCYSDDTTDATWPERNSPAMAWDSARHEAVLFGGYDHRDAERGDTWVFARTGTPGDVT